jgi:hypothetical protein
VHFGQHFQEFISGFWIIVHVAPRRNQDAFERLEVKSVGHLLDGVWNGLYLKVV